MKADKKTENQVIDMINSYANAYADNDIDAIMNLFLNDPDIVAIGTGDDEWAYGYDELKDGFKRDMEQSKGIKIEFKDITVSSIQNAAWTSSYMTMYAQVHGQEIILPGRLTAVFEKIEDIWYFAHLHYSLPAKNQEDGQSFPR